jgi:Spy/CpxP family protein refolding chaperone
MISKKVVFALVLGMVSPLLHAKEEAKQPPKKPVMMTKPTKFAPKPNVFSSMSEEQRKKIRDIANSMRAEMMKTAGELRQGQEIMKSIVMEPTFNESKAKTIADNQGKLYAKMIYMRMKTRHQIFQVMTPEQKKQLQDSMKRTAKPMMSKPPMPVKKP